MSVLKALSHPLDIEKNLFFNLSTWSKRLGPNMMVKLVAKDQPLRQWPEEYKKSGTQLLQAYKFLKKP